jgi:4'-phosphopantetheinyl transferase
MPLYKTIQVNPTTQILLWKITESYAQLCAEVPLKEKSAIRLNGMKSELHRRGFLSVRKLLQQIGYSDFDLHYDEFGKPYFEDGKHISISHSHEFASIIFSDSTSGIDLELRRDKIGAIADRFLNDQETAYLNRQAADYINKLTVLWGIKEVVFKIRNEAGISFKEHIKADDFKMSDAKTTAYLQMEHISQSFTIYFEEIENFTLVYAFENH